MAEPIRKAFVCGHPIGHSRSPRIHGFWLKQYGLAGSYEAIDVEPDGFSTFAASIRAGAFVGGNVTIPHKQTAFREADQLDSAAREIGAVNTLWREGNILHGSNTDAYGFCANLDDRSPGWADNSRRAIVLGAGGASRAVLYALKQRGFADIRIVNRTASRARTLATEFGAPFSAHGMEDLDGLLSEASLLVNTTSVGMHGELDTPVAVERLPADALVTDIVYVPLETPLLASARRHSLKTVDGLGMLLHQAVPGFEKWFGVRPEVSEDLRDLIVSDLVAKAA